MRNGEAFCSALGSQGWVVPVSALYRPELARTMRSCNRMQWPRPFPQRPIRAWRTGTPRSPLSSRRGGSIPCRNLESGSRAGIERSEAHFVGGFDSPSSFRSDPLGRLRQLPGNSPLIAELLLRDAEGLTDVAAFLGTQSFIDRRRIAVVGCSYGGIEALLRRNEPVASLPRSTFGRGDRVVIKSSLQFNANCRAKRHGTRTIYPGGE